MDLTTALGRRPGRSLPALGLLLAGLAAVPAHAAPITFLGAAIIPGDGTDRSGLPGSVLEDGVSPLNGLNGFGSGIAYTGYGDRYALLADRGPNKFSYPGGAAVDNTTSYPNRYQLFDVAVTPNAASSTGYTVSAVNVGTTLLKNSQGVQFTGLSTGFSTNPAVQEKRLDPESLRVAPDGTVYVSDEYGPHIYHFDRQGNQIGTLATPANISIAHPAATAAQEAALNSTGRVTNKGFEGLAISPDGKTLVAALQAPLTQDGGNSGLNTRIVVYDLTQPNAAPKQYVYTLDSTKTSISDLVAVNGHEFLVDERDGTGGAAGTKLLYKIDLDQAQAPTDLSGTPYGVAATAGLPKTSLPAGIVALGKTAFADIGALLNAANPFETGTGGLPDKLEGYAFGPDLPNGDHLLLVTNDNDFTLPGQSGYRPNYIFAFDVAASYLPDYVPEAFPPGYTFPVPEPASAALLGAGALALLGYRRRPQAAAAASAQLKACTKLT